ncbi:MAG TPA: hypothetical protein VFQ61_03670 [Polyangiaceae bacterium]|nr:hypothetical protein [Polyangiaceae bacterium]
MTLVYVFVALTLVAVAAVMITSRLFPDPPNLTDEDVVAELRKGHPITAIRWYRAIHGVGLKKAKSAVAELAKDHGIATKR